MAKQKDETKDEDKDRTLLPGDKEMIAAAAMTGPHYNKVYDIDQSQFYKGTSVLTLCEISFNIYNF